MSRPCGFQNIPQDKEEALEYGRATIKWGTWQCILGVIFATALILGVGLGSGQWGAGVGGSMGLWFGMAFPGLMIVFYGRKAVAYGEGKIEYPGNKAEVQNV